MNRLVFGKMPELATTSLSWIPLSTNINNRKKCLFLCFVDFRKAYDSVWQKALMLKLLRNGAKGKMFKIIDAMYDGCTAGVKNGNTITKIFDCKTGVRQGDVLSPNLFNLYVNDLPTHLPNRLDNPMLGDKSVNCLMYADDLVLISKSKEGLQAQLDALNVYCDEWELNINIDKTKIMIISNKSQNDDNICFHIGENELEIVKSYKYLGLELHSTSNWTNTSKNLGTRAWKATYKLFSMTAGVDIPPKQMMSLFDKLIKPVLCYNSEIWGSLISVVTNNTKCENDFWKKVEGLPIEKMHLKFCKRVLGVHSRATNIAVAGKLGRFPLMINIVQCIMKYRCHLDDPKYDSQLLRNAYIESKQLNMYKASWLNGLKKKFNTLHLAWDDSPPNMTKINLVIKTLKHSYLNYWRHKVNEFSNTKLGVYQAIKTHFGIENYLMDIKCRKARAALTAFRTSAHTLEIERGRYCSPKVPRELRLCNLCRKKGVNEIGDEFHMLMKYNHFDIQREDLFSKMDIYSPNFAFLGDRQKFIYLLTVEGAAVVHVGNFIKNALNVHRRNPAYSQWCDRVWCYGNISRKI